MENPGDNGLPFITRKMLAFEQGTSFKLMLVIWSRVAGHFTLSGYTKDGPFTFTFDAISATYAQIFNFAMTDIPIALSLTNSAVLLTKGDAYVLIDLLMNETTIQRLVNGYTWVGNEICWPNPAGEVAGGNTFETITIASANPDAGLQAIITVPRNEIWKIHGASVTLTTSLTVGARNMHLLIIHKGATRAIDIHGDVVQQNSLTYKYSFIPTATLAVPILDTEVTIPIPNDLMVAFGAIIGTNTLGLKFDDDHSSLEIYAERFIVPTA